jgi:Ca-activated chloride channel homolog
MFFNMTRSISLHQCAKSSSSVKKPARLFWCFLLIAAPVLAQEQPTFTLNVDVDLTELHVSVTDDHDHPVRNLGKTDFHVFEDLIEQKVSIFKREDIAVSLGLVIDNSRSIEARKKRLDAAALSFVQKGNPDDETFIVHFSDRPKLTHDFTDNIPDLEHALAGIRPFGQTAIYDALILASEHMAQAKHTKKVILLITDGIDNSSQHTLEEALEAAKRSGVAIYTVGLLSAAEGQKAEETLVHLAETSGGRAFFPESVDQARISMERVAGDLREQYLLGYFSSNPRNGKWRSIRLEIKPPAVSVKAPKLMANYRRGYYGPAN